MKKIGWVVGLLLVVIFASGCVECARTRREQFIEQNPELSPARKEAILAGEIWFFWPEEQVLASRGRPSEIIKNVCSGWGWRYDIWVYPGPLHLYFIDGYLARWRPLLTFE